MYSKKDRADYYLTPLKTSNKTYPTIRNKKQTKQLVSSKAKQRYQISYKKELNNQNKLPIKKKRGIY